MKTYYFHIMEGYPAAWGGNQICWLRNQKRNLKKSDLVNNLRIIKKEQEKTFKFRHENGYSCDESRYSYGSVRF